MRVGSLSHDGWLLLATCGVRSFAYGFLSVILGVYLDAAGLSAAAIGGIFTAALAGGAVMTIAITAMADYFGRRSLLIAGALLMAVAGSVFALSDHPMWLAIAAVFGSISPSGKEVGPFLAIEQSILPETISAEQRTTIFSIYNLVGSFAGALGALAVAVPSLLSLSEIAGYRYLLWAYVVAAVLLAALFASLSQQLEKKSAAGVQPRRFGVHKSRRIVAKLAGLFALDAFAGGFIVQSIVAYWFYLRFKTDLKSLGAIFFGTESPLGRVISRRPGDCPPIRVIECDGFYPSAVELSFVDRATDAESRVGGRYAVAAQFAFATRCADAPVLYHGCGRRR